MNPRRFTCAIAAVLVLGNAISEAKIDIKPPLPANAAADSKCPAGDGTNELEPLPITYLAPASTKGLIAEITGGDTKLPAPPWKFVKGAALGGTLHVDVYRSAFKDTHISGGEISLRYVKGKGDPATLRWVQLITTDAPLNGAVSPYIDPFPNDDPKGQDLPFYYTESEIEDRINGTNKFGAYDLRFYDFSSRNHPPNARVTWVADLYLVSWDKKRPGVVTIHDGVRWGWKAGCARNLPAVPPMVPGDDAPVPSTGSRLVLTGTVYAGEETTLTAVDPEGSVLTGVVVEFEGEDEPHVTDENGQVTVTVPTGVPSLVTRFRDLPDSPPVSTPVDDLPPGWNDALPPTIDDAPRYPVPGTDIVIGGGPFDGVCNGNRVRFGNMALYPRACSQHELVVNTSPDLVPGDQGPLIVSTDYGDSPPWEVTFISYSFESADTLLKRGEGGKGVIIVIGTEKRLDLTIRNLTPDIIELKTDRVRSSGGSPNRATIRYTGVNIGAFQLDVEAE